jgi:hypothetical protein
MPLGNAFYKPSDITTPQVPAPQNRTLTLLHNNVSPLPGQYGEMAYPNMNLMFDRPNLVFDANPIPARYEKIWSELGWFSWVYKDRDPLGFSHNVRLLKTLGIDQIVSDIQLNLPKPFITIKNQYPFTYELSPVNPKAFIPHMETEDGTTNFETGKTTYKKMESQETQPIISKWDETQISLSSVGDKLTSDMPSVLFIQKTYLPGWKAEVNGNRVEIKRGLQALTPKPSDEDETHWRELEVLMSIPLEKGKNQVELKFEPIGLRLGFFLFFAFSGVFSFFLIRSRLS